MIVATKAKQALHNFTPPEDIERMFAEKLAASDLTIDDANKLGMDPLQADEVKALDKIFWPVPAFRIHYFDLDGKTPLGNNYFRLRWLRKPNGDDPPKYLQPTGSSPHAYFPRSVAWTRVAQDTKQQLIITEGELKAASACGQGFPTIGIGGVHSFQKSKDRISFLPELEAIKWDGREVVICYDADPKPTTNKNVERARQDLADQLIMRGAIVRSLDLPMIKESGKTGLDDFLAEKGGAALEELLDATAEAPSMLLSPDLTEDGLALEFTARHIDDYRYCHTTGAWFAWSGRAWRKDETRKAFASARAMCRDISRSLKPTSADRQRLGKVATASAIEKFAQSDPSLSVTANIWDPDPFMLGTPGGTVDLRTGMLSEPAPEDHITKLTAVAPAVTATCPEWLKFLGQATNHDQELIRFLQQWAGYSLTGDTSAQELLFIYGTGGNGKGVFMTVLSKILNEYCTAAAMDTFTASRTDKHSTDLASLRGARLVTASETEEGHSWAEARLKMMTGGDPITARFMRQDNFTYLPQFKLAIIGNHKPELKSVDDAAKRRFNIVPFTHKPPKKDVKLGAKLEKEWPGILRWMIAGCLDWQRNGLVRPRVVAEATREYFEAQDSFGMWLSECCVMEKGAKERPDKLRMDFTRWGMDNGEREPNRKKFRGWVERTPGLAYTTKHQNTLYVEGVRLRKQSKF